MDINIYDTIGSLINTTQPKLFDGFKSKIINKEAYESIIKRNRFFYSTQEYIDDTKYNSSYFPLKNIEGDIVAIINIPYFEYNNVGKNNMSYFIVTYFNIILVLLGLSALVVILMTRRTLLRKLFKKLFFAALLAVDFSRKRLFTVGQLCESSTDSIDLVRI